MNPIASTSAPARSYRRNVLLILLGTVCSSWRGLGVRMMESATAWQILTYRSLALSVFLLLFYVAAQRHRRHYRPDNCGGGVHDKRRRLGYSSARFCCGALPRVCFSWALTEVVLARR